MLLLLLLLMLLTKLLMLLPMLLSFLPVLLPVLLVLLPVLSMLLAMVVGLLHCYGLSGITWLLHVALLYIALLHIALLHIALLHIALLHVALLLHWLWTAQQVKVAEVVRGSSRVDCHLWVLCLLIGSKACSMREVVLFIKNIFSVQIGCCIGHNNTESLECRNNTCKHDAHAVVRAQTVTT